MEQCFFNGVNGEDGTWFQQPVPCEALTADFLGQSNLGFLGQVEPEPRGLEFGRSASELAEAGWGIILPKEVDQKIVEALRPLVDHRRAQASQQSERRFGPFDYYPDESKFEFLKAMGAPDPGMPVEPDRMPYYLLLVGSPQDIPFEFQYRMATDYAVGRIYFDTPEEYAVYARSVVDWERQQAERQRRPRLALFGVSNHDDVITALATKYLLEPLYQSLADDTANWEVRKYTGDETTKRQLARLLGGAETPDLLFSVAHGLCYKSGHPLQRERQGGLVCRDWPGPQAPAGRVTDEMWFGAPDIDANARLHGLIMFQTGCFTAGTPKLDVLRGSHEGGPYELADQDFVAAMPKRMLSHEMGAALAVIAHVDRAFEFSFVRNREDEQCGAFRSCLKALAAGLPVGFAMSFFTHRAPVLASELLAAQRNKATPLEQQLDLWKRYHDARTYVVLGDPACRVGGGSRWEA